MTKERKLTVSIAWANIFSLLLLVAAAIPTAAIWYAVWGKSGIVPVADHKLTDAELETWLWNEVLKLVVFMVAVIGGVFIHEYVHGLTWARYTKNGWKSINFGFMWKMLTPYCHCSEPLKVRHYITGALMPLIVVGFFPLIVGLCTGCFLMTAFGVFYVSGAAGDILIAWKLRHESADNTVLDHPTECGCIIYEEE